MIISDLNYMEVAAANVEGGRFTYFQNDKVALKIFTNISIDDNSAEAFADSFAKGNNSFSKTLTLTEVTRRSSFSSSRSFAAVD